MCFSVLFVVLAQCSQIVNLEQNLIGGIEYQLVFHSIHGMIILSRFEGIDIEVVEYSTDLLNKPVTKTYYSPTNISRPFFYFGRNFAIVYFKPAKNVTFYGAYGYISSKCEESIYIANTGSNSLDLSSSSTPKIQKKTNCFFFALPTRSSYDVNLSISANDRVELYYNANSSLLKSGTYSYEAIGAMHGVLDISSSRSTFKIQELISSGNSSQPADKLPTVSVSAWFDLSMHKMSGWAIFGIIILVIILIFIIVCIVMCCIRKKRKAQQVANENGSELANPPPGYQDTNPPVYDANSGVPPVQYPTYPQQVYPVGPPQYVQPVVAYSSVSGFPQAQMEDDNPKIDISNDPNRNPYAIGVYPTPVIQGSANPGSNIYAPDAKSEFTL